jgi:DNA helicase-2/ATP-dependent DNA helicase PcrA
LDLLEELNDSQREAVTYCDGPELVIAGAGSGKTRVLTYKIAYLIEQGFEPWNILALTFTNKAAREMKQRIARQVGQKTAQYLWMGTFHSIFSRILRIEAQSIGFSQNFTIYDENDSRSLVKSIIKEMNLDDKVYKPATIEKRIGMAKNYLIMPDAYAADPQMYESDSASKIPATRNIYSAYCERCRKSNAMDFDDLLVYTYLLFKNNAEIRAKYAERFHYVLVDEYQDTNYAQHQIVMLLSGERQKVCVVGDDAQSIYSFRGANIDNILNFTKSFPNARLFKLERNYRSTQLIVKAANSLISHNREQIRKDVYSRNDTGEPVFLHNAYSDTEESTIVCNDIERIKRSDHCEYSDFAILYRTNAQSRSFEEALRKRNIPYRIYGGLSFYQRKEIKDIIAYFRLTVNPDDEEALKRIINYPARGIGDTTLSKIIAKASERGISLWNMVCNPEQSGLNVNSGTMSKLKAFCLLISGFMERFVREDAFTLGTEIIRESGVGADIHTGREPEDLSRQENLEELLGGLQDFVASRQEEGLGDEVSLSDYLQEVSLLTDLDSDNGADAPRVTLMTIHSAKGLEFPTVFIVGLEENIFPSPMSVDNPRQLEEERRLLYVAITRAEKHCVLSCAQYRYRYGRLEYDTPSRFIRDIDLRYLKTDNSDESARKSPLGGYMNNSYREQRTRRNDSYGATRTAMDRSSMVSNESDNKVKKSVDTSLPTGMEARRFKPVTKASTPPTNVRPDDHLTALAEGDMIEHERFGLGTVVRIEGKGENTKATVEFRNTGTKQLLLKFARFKVIK